MIIGAIFFPKHIQNFPFSFFQILVPPQTLFHVFDNTHMVGLPGLVGLFVNKSAYGTKGQGINPGLSLLLSVIMTISITIQ